jgi:hypothetical protein
MAKLNISNCISDEELIIERKVDHVSYPNSSKVIEILMPLGVYQDESTVSKHLRRAITQQNRVYLISVKNNIGLLRRHQ